MMYMTRSVRSYPPRVAAGLALALFLAGTNYCLVGMIAASTGHGSGVSCMAIGSPGSCHEAPRASHCGGASADRAASPQGSPAPAPAGTAPCCVALAPVLAMQGAKILAGDLGPAIPRIIAAAEPAPVSSSWHGHRDFHDTGPPPLHSRAPLSPRAPPLA